MSKRGVEDSSKGKKRKRILILFILIVAFFFFVYFFIYSPVFKIKKIIVSGVTNNDIVNEIQIIARREISGYDLSIWPRDNILFLNKEMLSAVIENQIFLDELEIEKKLLHTLKITALEKLPKLLWNESDEYYYIDRDGYVMGAIGLSDIEYELPFINRGTTTQVVVGRKIVEADNIQFINNFYTKFSEKIKDMYLTQVVVSTVDNSEATFYTNEGWYFIVNTHSDIDRVMYNLREILAQKISQREDLSYIDLRIEDRIYYKLISEE
jgi:cell division septal protein FtsQ